MAQMLKPSACCGCPFEKHGKYFVPDKVVPDSKVMFVGQNPGEHEENGHAIVKSHWQGKKRIDETRDVPPQPLIGPTGRFFNERFLSLTGLERSEVSVGNIIRCRPGLALGMKPNGLPSITTAMKLETSKADIVRAIKHCSEAYLRIPDSVDTIVAMGRHAMFGLTGIQHEDVDYGRKQGVLESWRGYGVHVDSWKNIGQYTIDTSDYHDMSKPKRIFFTIHPAHLFEDKTLFHATLNDFNKVKLLRQGLWPKELPTWTIGPPNIWPSFAAFDTEYDPNDDDRLIEWSLCDSNNNLYYVQYDYHPYSFKLPENMKPKVLIQNAVSSADMKHLHMLLNNAPFDPYCMMLAHTVLWTGEKHNLNYIQSMYGTLNRTKHLSKTQPELYSVTDAWEPMQMWRSHFTPEFKRDPASWNVYIKYRQPLINIYGKAHEHGSKVDTSRLAHIKEILEQHIAAYQAEAQTLTDDDTFNLGGNKALMEELYGHA